MKHFLIIIFFISGNVLFSQTRKNDDNSPKFLLKTNCRGLFLQPSLSAEYFFTEKLSLNIGASYFWTGRKIYGQTEGDRMGQFFLNTGPSKGYDIFSDINYTLENRIYFGLGYMYRYSYFIIKIIV